MLYETDYLMHHGIKGQKWGVRRYQNEDGTRTVAGLKRDYRQAQRELRQAHRSASKQYRKKQVEINKETRKVRKELKVDYKAKKISRDDYKDRKRQIAAAKGALHGQNEVNTAVGHWVLKKYAHQNLATLHKELHGENSRQYKRAQRLVNRATESYGNYVVSRRSDGTFAVTRVDVYYY